LFVCFFFRGVSPRFAKDLTSSCSRLIFEQGNEKEKESEGRDLENFTTLANHVLYDVYSATISRNISVQL